MSLQAWKIGLLLVFVTTCLAGADASGRWTGTLVEINSDGSASSPEPALLVLKQDGAKLTGTAGPDDGSQRPIKNGKAENGNLSFEISPVEGAIMRFTLTHDGDAIKGDVHGESPDGKRTGKLDLKRTK